MSKAGFLQERWPLVMVIVAVSYHMDYGRRWRIFNLRYTVIVVLYKRGST